MEALNELCNCTRITFTQRKEKGNIMALVRVPHVTSTSIVQRVIESILKGELDERLLDMPIRRVTWALGLMGCATITENYIKEVILERQCEISECMTLIECMINTFELDNCPDILWLCVFEKYGLSHKWVTTVQQSKGRTDKEQLLKSFRQDNSEWYQYWRAHNPICVFCGINLEGLRDLAERREMISSMPCCGQAACKSCVCPFLGDVSKWNGRYCPVCHALFVYNPAVGHFTLESERRALESQRQAAAPLSIGRWTNRSHSVFLGNTTPSAHAHYEQRYVERRLSSLEEREEMFQPCRQCGHVYNIHLGY